MAKLKTQRPKVKRKRKPMSDEQKKAAAERLAAARAAKGPVLNLAIHESIRDLPDSHPLAPKHVKQWIKQWKRYLASIKAQRVSKESNERQQYQIADNYVKNMQAYLNTGIWIDQYWGEDRQHKMFSVCVKPAYRDGVIQRTRGVYYRDLGIIYGEEHDD